MTVEDRGALKGSWLIKRTYILDPKEDIFRKRLHGEREGLVAPGRQISREVYCRQQRGGEFTK
jgi:hypothetical protein